MSPGPGEERIGADEGMGWLEWCQRKFPTYPWRHDGCKLIPADEEKMATLRTLYVLPVSNDYAPVGGMNPHGDGRPTLERGRALFDIPFWAAKWLVFDRDQGCQDCGVKQDYVDAARDGYHFDRPLTPKDNGYPLFATRFEVHHIIPVVKGGSNCTHNLMLLCEPCHDRKKGKGGAVVPNTQLKLLGGEDKRASIY